MKYLLLIATPAVLFAQEIPMWSPSQQGMGNAFQQNGWIRFPGGAPVAVHVDRPDGQSGPVLGKPFWGTELRHTSQVLADGTHVDHSDTSSFYRDAQGRMRAESPDRILIYDPGAGVTYNLDPKGKAYLKWTSFGQGENTSIAVVGDSTWVNTHSGDTQAVVHNVTPSQGRLPMHTEPVTHYTTEDLPPQIMNGVAVKGSRVTLTIPTGTFGNDRDVKVVHERWYSDDLQVLVKSINSDPRYGLTTYELTGIVRGNPSPALFQPPTDYTLHGDSFHGK